jgi:hypothetical protein
MADCDLQPAEEVNYEECRVSEIRHDKYGQNTPKYFY